MADDRTKAAPGFKLCTNINCKDSNNERTHLGVKQKQCPHCGEQQIRRGRRLQYAETADSLAIGAKRAHVSNKAKPQKKRLVKESSQLPSTSSPHGDEPPAPASSRDHSGPEPFVEEEQHQLGPAAGPLPLGHEHKPQRPTAAASGRATYAGVAVGQTQQYLLAAGSGRMLFQLPVPCGVLGSVVTYVAAHCSFDKDHGSIAVSSSRFYHVYAVPIRLKEDVASVVVLCECSTMGPAWSSLRGQDLTQCSAEDVETVCSSCIHAAAVQEKHRQELEDWLQTVPDALLHGTVKQEEVVCPWQQQQQQQEQQQQLSRQPLIVLDVEDVLVSYAVGDRRVVANVTDQGFLRCCFCPPVRQMQCNHVKALWQYVQTDPFGQDLFEGAVMQQEAGHQAQQPKTQSVARSSVSQSRIVLGPQLMFKQRVDTGFAVMTCNSCQLHVQHNGALGCSHLVPEVPDTVCKCGAPWSSADPVQQGWLQEEQGVLLAPTVARRVKVYYRRCSSCSNRLLYTGEKDAVFNHSHKYLMCHEVGLQFWLLFTKQRLTFSAHHEQLKVNYELHGCAELLPSRNTHRVMLHNFLECLEVPYEELFCCPICRDSPPVVVLDCKEMGIQRQHAQHCERPVDGGLRAPEALKFEDAVPIGNPKVRAGLWKWANGTDLTEAEAEEVVVAAENSEPEVYQVLQHMAGRGRLAREWCTADRALYGGFFKRISISYPAGSVVNMPEQHRSTLHGILEGQQLSLHSRQALAETFPALHVLCAEAPGWTAVPESFRPLLRKIVKKAAAPGTCEEKVGPVADAAMEDTHVYMPSFPLLRLLATYPSLERRPKQRSNTCNKASNSHNAFTPGLCLCFCGHGVCLGFKILVRCEGPSTIFEIIATRFVKAPLWIIYDNACNLHNYCIKRLPQFFCNTRFLVDRLHWFNHSGCGRGYCLNDLNQDTVVAVGVTLEQLNTQVCEQCNARLENIRTQVAYATHKHAMSFLKFFLAMTNKKIIDGLQS